MDTTEGLLAQAVVRWPSETTTKKRRTRVTPKTTAPAATFSEAVSAVATVMDTVLALPTGATLGYEEVTAEQAEAYLDTIAPVGEDGSRGQRSRSRDHIEQYVEILFRDEWVLTPDPIVFNRDGHLINGQHRLSAVVATGATVPFIVGRNWSHELFFAMDKGKKRSTGDTLYVHGESNVSALATCLRLLYLVNQDRSQRSWRTRVSDKQIAQTLLEHPDIRKSLVWRKSARHTGLVGSALALAHYLISQVAPPEAVAEFCETHAKGYHLGPGDPLAELRAWGLAKRGREETKTLRNTPRSHIHLYLIIKAWNQTQQGVRVSKITYTVPFTLPEVVPYVPPEERPLSE